LLDDLLRKAGRQPIDVKRSAIRALFCWRTDAEREELADIYRRVTSITPPLPTGDLLPLFREQFGALVGTPDEVIEQLQAFEAAGIEEVMWQYVTLDSLKPLEIIAEDVLPYLGKKS
jgi:alkanesulfonate monooxygenase SsuD/methylene tetrahydromethanopterin reductase-like flavin-dependent oxidoreductase (luciferase family)